MFGLYYITSKHVALKRFTGLSEYDLNVLAMLFQLNAPCHYRRLHDVIAASGYVMDECTFSKALRYGVDNKLMSRTPVSGNVLYSITLEGRKLLRAFNRELDAIVAKKVRQYGNGLELE